MNRHDYFGRSASDNHSVPTALALSLDQMLLLLRPRHVYTPIFPHASVPLSKPLSSLRAAHVYVHVLSSSHSCIWAPELRTRA
eukprot:689826-Pleurochrysis_carterae.AAC.2